MLKVSNSVLFLWIMRKMSEINLIFIHVLIITETDSTDLQLIIEPTYILLWTSLILHKVIIFLYMMNIARMRISWVVYPCHISIQSSWYLYLWCKDSKNNRLMKDFTAKLLYLFHKEKRMSHKDTLLYTMLIVYFFFGLLPL